MRESHFVSVKPGAREELNHVKARQQTHDRVIHRDRIYRGGGRKEEED